MSYYFGLLKCNILNLDEEIILEIAILRILRTTWSWLIKERDTVGRGLQSALRISGINVSYFYTFLDDDDCHDDDGTMEM